MLYCKFERSAVDPDPHGSTFIWPAIIQILDGQKDLQKKTKREESSYLEVLGVLVWGLEASAVAWTSSADYLK